MSNLYIRVKTRFYTHRKTARLRAMIGDDAYWVPPRLWAYCAENQPDGNLDGYTSEEIAELIGCQKHASSILQALKSVGLVHENGMVHDWAEHNGYHETFAKRAKTAANARWSKVKQEMETEKERGEKHCSKDATSTNPEPKSISKSERIGMEQELGRATKELSEFARLSDYPKQSASYKRILELRPRVAELRSKLGVVA